MNPTRQQKLVAKVAAVNRANAEAAKLFALLAPAFAPFVGQKIETATGDLTAKVKKALPPLPDVRGAASLHVYRSQERYALGYVVKTCVPLPEISCIYHETHVHLGEMNNGVLTKLGEPQVRRADFTAAEIEAKRKALSDAKDAVSAAQSALGQFGEYDN